MSYAQYLRQLLAPLGVYQLNAPFQGGELEALGDAFDQVEGALEVLNRERGTTILMVTHDAFTASCCRRVIFLRDGQIFQELSRGELDRRAFFAQIIRVITQLGGEMEDVL